MGCTVALGALQMAAGMGFTIGFLQLTDLPSLGEPSLLNDPLCALVDESVKAWHATADVLRLPSTAQKRRSIPRFSKNRCRKTSAEEQLQELKNRHGRVSDTLRETGKKLVED